MTVQVTGINLSTGAPYTATAAGNGSTDDTTVLQNAINACGLIKLPAATYRTTAKLTFPIIGAGGFVVAGGGIIGSGSGSCTIFADHTDTAIEANSGVTAQGLTHRGYKITRGSSAAAGGTFGLDIGAGTTLGGDTPDKCRLKDLILDGHNTGLRVSSTGWCRMVDITAINNDLDGISLVAQWQTRNINSNNNGRYGFYMAGVLAGGNSMGNYRGLSASGNGSHGLYATGAAIGIRLIDCTFSSNGGHGALFDNVNNGFTNQLTNCVANSNTGGIGFYFSANTSQNSLWGCSASGQTYGAYSDALSIAINGGTWNGNSAYGILIATGKASINGVTASGNLNGVGASAAVTNISVTFTNASGSTTPFDLAAASGVYRNSNNPAP